MTPEEMMAELNRLKVENESLKNSTAHVRSLSLKISEKGAVSLYGLGRFPVTLYKEQWQKVLGAADEIKAFIKANDAQLKAKEQASL